MLVLILRASEAPITTGISKRTRPIAQTDTPTEKCVLNLGLSFRTREQKYMPIFALPTHLLRECLRTEDRIRYFESCAVNCCAVAYRTFGWSSPLFSHCIPPSGSAREPQKSAERMRNPATEIQL